MIQILILTIMLLIVPFWVGGIFSGVERGSGRALFQWISGQFFIWGGAEVLSVVMLMRRVPFQKATILLGCYLVAVLLYACGAIVRQRVRTGKFPFHLETHAKHSLWSVTMWILFAGVLGCQLAQTVLLFGQGVTRGYTYTFGISTPFALWMGFLSEVSGMSPVRVEQIVMPMVFLCMSYGVFYLLGVKIFVKKRVHRALFMLVISLISLIGGAACRYWFGPVWQTVRNNPEVAMLGAVLIPYLVLLMVIQMRMFRKKKSGR